MHAVQDLKISITTALLIRELKQLIQSNKASELFISHYYFIIEEL